MAAALAALPLTAVAGEIVDHYQAAPSDTLPQALDNLAKPKLSDTDMERAHALSYALRAAVAEMETVAEGMALTAQQVHNAAEAHRPDALRGAGTVFLEQSVPLSR